MNQLALTALVVMALSGCDARAPTPEPGRAPASGPAQLILGDWVSASAKTELTVRALGGDEYELTTTVVMDRKNRRFDLTRRFVTRLVGRQLVVGGVQMAGLDEKGDLLYGGQPFRRTSLAQSSKEGQ